MPVFLGTELNEFIKPASVFDSVTRSPAGAVPGAEDDVLLGRGGDDQLDGAGGNDVLDGGDGDDFLRGNTGADILIGGAGTDWATYFESAAGVTVNLTTGSGSSGSAEGDQLFEIEWLNGSNFKDTLIGNTRANVLNGLSGDDLLNGHGGSDTLNGGNADDTVVGGDGNDTLHGENGNDTLSGGSGRDSLHGGAGNDLLTGGLGQDSLTGGEGFDKFNFASLGESLAGSISRDAIADFVGRGALAGDVIDVSTIDANELAGGNQAFTFIGDAAFTGARQLRYSDGLLQGTTDLDFAPEFEVALTGAPVLTVSDIDL